MMENNRTARAARFLVQVLDLGVVYTLNLIQTNLILVKFVNQLTISRRRVI